MWRMRAVRPRRSANEIDAHLRGLRRELRGLSWHRRRRVLEETRDHLRCALEDGATPGEAIGRLGRPVDIARGYPGRRRTHRAATVVVPIALLAFTPSVQGPLGRITRAVAPSSAATPPTVPQLVGGCAALWDGPAGAAYRREAARLDATRARVSVAYAIRFTRPAVRRTVCTIRLEQDPLYAPDQPLLVATAHAVGARFVFDGLKTTHARAEALSTNARVGRTGRLTLAGIILPSNCPSGPVGTQIVSVRAGRSTTLTSSGPTHVSAVAARTLVVDVRNAGHVTVRGPIVTIAMSGANSRWFRARPKVRRLLTPGAVDSFRFTLPDLGRGDRQVRAASTGVSCETRLSDNRATYRVVIGR
jgi:hypothetical protein